jgi:hypothetical protein
MKKNYETLKEEINRIKLLFGESRLYGNIENDVKIITEQYKLFSNIADAFKVTLKSFDQLDTFTKFLNREINNVDDLIKHVNDFEGMWKSIYKNLNTDLLKRNLIKLKKVIDGDRLKNLSEEELKLFLKGFPYKGGMQDIIYDMWAKSKGLSTNLPQKVDNRVVKLDPKTKEILIGRTNEKGVIVYKNQKGQVVPVEDVVDGKSNVLPNDEKLGNKKPDYTNVEDVDFVDVTESTTLVELDDKWIKATTENITNIENAVESEAKGGAVYEEKQKFKSEKKLSKKQEIRLKELEIELQKAKNRESELEIQKELLNMKNNPEGESEMIPDGEPKTDVIIDENVYEESESNLRKFLKLPKTFWDKIRILKPVADEGGFIRVSKMIGSSVVDPLGLLRPFNIPPIKKVEGVPGAAQRVVLPQNIIWAWGTRRLGGLAVNGIIWSWYFTYFKGPNPFSLFGYESDPDQYYFPKIYATYWKNLSKTPFVGVIPNAVVKYGEKQVMELNNDIKKYTGKTLEEWQNHYVNVIPKESSNYLEKLNCEQLKSMRTDGDNPVLTSESKKLIAEHVSKTYNDEIDVAFKKLEDNTGMFQKIVEIIAGIKMETPEIADRLFEEAKTENGTSVIEEQFNLAIVKKCGTTSENDTKEESDGEENTWYVEGDIQNL